MSALINMFEDNLESFEDESDNVVQFRSHQDGDNRVTKIRSTKRQSGSNQEFTGKTLTADEERELVIRAKKGDLRARNELTMANMKLVASIAKKYEDRGIPLSDLMQEGSIGLMSAVNKFDIKMGHRFSTYAAWWVREAITRALSNKSRIVRLPVHLNELMTKVRRVRSSLAVKLGRQATVEEIAMELDETVEKIEKALNASQTCMSLDQKVSMTEDDGCSLGETIVDEDATTPIDQANAPYFTSQIATLLSCLNERERKVIRMRFGMDNGEEASLREISEALGLTRDQVGKISCLAMRKLKKAASREEFEDYLAA
ncbi:RNA polymerase sigma factor RpoD/SigA [Candidatus Obscuribacterales bacterium]|nr:RNA polymerase sigma factor RpoD/SigA [Candidatus Obscuribacterales bacterium]MBX3153519.1 RNA polymerase sigma factor RpoD/SigA [Candidatus Obscuribacterales bacterium]